MAYELPAQDHLREKWRGEQAEQGRELEALRRQIAKHSSAALAYAEALVGESDDVVIAQIEQGLQSWIDDTSEYWYEPDWQYVGYACECLRAITLLDGVHYDTVELVTQAVDRILPDVFDKGLTRMSDVLSGDPRYHAVAEGLAHQRIEAASQPNVAASTRVEALLELCPILARIDINQTSLVFERARVEAAKWDGQADSRALALLRTASAAQADVGLSDEQAAHLAAVFDYVGELDREQKEVPYFGELIRVVSRTNPGLALRTLREAESKEHVSLGEGLLAIGQGLLDNQRAEADLIWPLFHLVSPDVDAWPLFRQAAETLVTGGSESKLNRVLEEWALYIRRDLAQRLRLKQAEELVQWAHGHEQASHSTVEHMRRYATQIEGTGLDGERISGYEPRHYRDEPSKVAHRLRDAVARSPMDAFSMLQDLRDDEIVDLSFAEIKTVVETVLLTSTTRQAVELANIMVRRNWDYESGHVLLLLLEIAKRTRSAPHALQATVGCIRQLVDTSFLALATQTAYEEESLRRLIDCEDIDVEARFEIVLSAVMDHLVHLSSDQICWLIGCIGERLSGTKAGEVFAVLLDHAMRGLVRQDKPG